MRYAAVIINNVGVAAIVIHVLSVVELSEFQSTLILPCIAMTWFAGFIMGLELEK